MCVWSGQPDVCRCVQVICQGASFAFCAISDLKSIADDAERLPGCAQAGDKLKGKANEAGRKAQNVVGNNAGLPSPQEALDKAKDALPGGGVGGGGGAVRTHSRPAACQIAHAHL